MRLKALFLWVAVLSLVCWHFKHGGVVCFDIDYRSAPGGEAKGTVFEISNHQFSLISFRHSRGFGGKYFLRFSVLGYMLVQDPPVPPWEVTCL